MSIEQLAVVLHHSTAKGTRKIVLMGIANHAGDGGSWPTVRTLARYANADRRTVQRAIDWLQAHGEVVVQYQAGGPKDMDDDDRPNRYDVTVVCPSWCDRTTHHRDTRGRPERLAGTLPPPPPRRSRGGGTHAAPPAAPTPPQGAAPTPPEPSPEPTPLLPPKRSAPCLTCGQGEARCLAQQVHWPAEDRHPYQPLAVLHATAGRPPETTRRRSRG